MARHFDVGLDPEPPLYTQTSWYEKEISHVGWAKAAVLPTEKGGFTSGGQDKTLAHPALKGNLTSFLVAVKPDESL